MKVAESKRRREEAFVPPEVCIEMRFRALSVMVNWLYIVVSNGDCLTRNLAKKVQMCMLMTRMMLLLLHRL